jgi:PAS domain S-box-containing protein
MNLKDINSRYQMVNKTFTEWYGLSGEQVIGKTMHEFYSDDYADAFTGLEQQEVLKQRRTIRRELQRPFADGTVRPVAVVKFPVFDSDGHIKGIGTFNVDISMHRQLEDELRNSEALVRQVLEACPVPITMNRVDDGVIIYESPSTGELLRYGRPQTGKSVISRWVNPNDRRSYIKRLRQTRAIDGFEVNYRKADGERFRCALSSRLIEYRGEEVVVTSLFDLTERYAVEEELAQHREMLHRSEKLSALGELLASVAHELNNPLSIVTGQSELLQETSDNPRTAARARKISDAAERCGRIVNTFLAMARQRPLESRALDLNDIVNTALEVTAYALRSCDIEVVLELSAELAPVYGDADQLTQVILNLIVNAQQALEDRVKPRRLHISSALDKRYRQVILRVRDNGPGIPTAVRTRIFEPFFTTKPIGKGTGIGLALCHRIIESHDGMIEADSTCSQGAAFIIRLPAGRWPAVAEPAGNSATLMNAMLKVLVIDDETGVTELLRCLRARPTGGQLLPPFGLGAGDCAELRPCHPLRARASSVKSGAYPASLR